MLSKLPIIASSQSYLNPLNNAKTILLALVGAGGVIVLIFAYFGYILLKNCRQNHERKSKEKDKNKNKKNKKKNE